MRRNEAREIVGLEKYLIFFRETKRGEDHEDEDFQPWKFQGWKVPGFPRPNIASLEGGWKVEGHGT